MDADFEGICEECSGRDEKRRRCVAVEYFYHDLAQVVGKWRG